MSKVLVIAEHDDRALNSATARALSCATALKPEIIDIAVFAADGEAVCQDAAALPGVSKVLRIARKENAQPLAAVLAPQIAALAKRYTHVLLPGTTFGKDVMPRVAALLGVAAISDIMRVVDARTFERPIYAGNAVSTVQAADGEVIVATVRSASFPAAGKSPASAPVESVNLDVAVPRHTRFINTQGGNSERPDLQSAARVISGGRGVGSKENFAVIYHLADKLGAAVGASRAAVDAGFVPNDMQVGQTGKIIAPQLYIAIGISGAIQHLAGIKDAGFIVAINKDPDAPIFEIADIGLVGDLFEILPQLEQALG